MPNGKTHYKWQFSITMLVYQRARYKKIIKPYVFLAASQGQTFKIRLPLQSSVERAPAPVQSLMGGSEGFSDASDEPGARTCSSEML